MVTDEPLVADPIVNSGACQRSPRSPSCDRGNSSGGRRRVVACDPASQAIGRSPSSSSDADMRIARRTSVTQPARGRRRTGLPGHLRTARARQPDRHHQPAVRGLDQDIPRPRLAKAVVDRITHKAHIIATGTESWRFPPRTAAPRTQTIMTPRPASAPAAVATMPSALRAQDRRVGARRGRHTHAGARRKPSTDRRASEPRRAARASDTSAILSRSMSPWPPAPTHQSRPAPASNRPHSE